MFSIKYSERNLRILDFDLETIAAGFADPNWVPQNVTAVAWSWIGEDKVEVRIRKKGLKQMLDPLLKAIDEADMLTGHNIIKFDLPVLNSELLRNGYPSLGPKLVQDTMQIVKTKGFKKGQDNLSSLVRNPVQKLPLNWQEWQDAYEEKDWGTVIERVASDVVGHKILRQRMLDRGWLKPHTRWTP